MRKDKRHAFILREVNLHNKVLSVNLSEQLDVSDDTVRRDIKQLATEGKLIRVHGGAVGKSFVTPFNVDNVVYAATAKAQIAYKALSLIKNNMIILTEGGTTMLELAKIIPSNLKATFITISPQVAITLAQHESIDVISIGGKLTKNANLHIGASVVNQLYGLKSDLCILGANAFSSEEGLTDLDWEVVQVKKALIRSAKKVAVVSISEKLNTVKWLNICPVGQVDYLITELDPGDQRLNLFTQQGIKVL
ncbi:DeoR family transcriptional regulator [Parapedobacter pyrenivorans]|uniref:DeoR family transcriptional regulator n=1 Tax=Parapedobacter pyrenivorans TaxID=1305674 RepID=A0A917HMG3_9SPHI|nr:DeoR/GlpR family DNA-binding transcription regulator [Parapedobacter pyrenivorans]GGG84203.1 DeoR family transcriptional regulator [Parapedobacter pyrenivorans]